MPLLEALSFVGGVAVTKFIEDLIDVISAVLLPFPTERNVREEIQKLETELKKIRTVLDDAEERQMKEKPVKDWMTNLQNLAYDVEDVVDEFATEIGKRNLMMERQCSSSKRRRLNLDSVAFNSGMMSKIKELTDKLKDLKPQMDQLQLKMVDCGRPRRVEARLQPTSVQIEPHVFGRDEEKQTILDLLLKDEDEKSFVIPIVGMGGIGKTTLAQLVYNDASIQNHFHLKAWVCVSEEFDVARITKEILKSVTPNPCNENDLNKLQEMLKKELSEKKFLIVLDDVWNENYDDWTILQSPFLTRTLGSKIIVTTRNHRVSSTMGASHSDPLKVLSDDDCMSLFSQHALGARDFRGHPNLKDVAVKIVRKCNGLPLAAKTLGGLLRSNVDRDVWEDISESEIWQLSEEHQCGIIPALQLSYHHLPPHLKRCFAYCSIIPKDYEFEEEQIILLWRAQGFLQEARDRRIDDLGSKYFRDLVSRSLFQISIKDSSRFVMHDLIHDLAESVAGEICFKIDGTRQISKHARHLAYVADEYDGIKKFEGICEAQQLRTFLPLSSDDSYITPNVLMYLLPNLRCLRALSLEGYEIKELSDFLGDLKHLRYLNFSNNGVIKSLPESVSTLYNLETLLLKGCKNLERLPSEMEKLVNLCHLDIRGVDKLQGMPSNFSTLTNLQTLSMFVLGKQKGYQIRELKDLSNLKGQLCISGLQNIVEPRDAWTSKLHDKSILEKLQFRWSEELENRRQEVEEEVLDGLQPSKTLKELGIEFYCGAMLANWVGSSSFNDLQSLCLDDCPNLLSLPSIGTLPSLKKLRIKGLKSVTSVGVEFFGENTRNPFSALEVLEFEDMPKWEKWNLYEVDEEARKFPRLRELLITYCPLLLGSVPESFPSLEKLTICGCEKLIISIQSSPKLSEFKIERCHEVVYKGFAEGSSLKRVSLSGISKFSCGAECVRLRSIKVASLEINDCEEFRENNWGWLTRSMSIGSLKIEKCEQMVSIGAEEEREELKQLKIPYSIEVLVIRKCSRLEKLSTTLHSLTSLVVVNLFKCPKLKCIARSNLPLNLKVLTISWCDNLESLMLDEEENVNSNNACLLQRLGIQFCSSLKRLNWSELPTSLKQLDIFGCSKLESIAQEIQDNSSLESIYIDGCEMIKELPQGLNKLKHLQRMTIYCCSNLISFPESGLPTTNLKKLLLEDCQRLQALPGNMHNLNSLEELEIRHCPNVTSFPEQGIPPNIRSLKISGANICKPIMEWGLHRLISLKSLGITNGCPDAVSFPQTQMLPSSLTTLELDNFPKLVTLSSNGFLNLTSLTKLSIFRCPNLKSLPEKNMLSSLLKLYIHDCPILSTRCKRDEGLEWPKIAHIPRVEFSIG